MKKKIEISDALDRRLVIDGPAQRIVSLVPSITETLFALGAGGAVLGVTEYCTHPPAEVAAKEKVGGVKNPDIDKIVQIEPDLIIANREENHKKHIERLDALDIPLFLTYPRTVEQGIEMIMDIARMTGTEKKGGELTASLEGTYRAISREVERRGRKSVFCPIWKDPYMSINRDTFIHDVLWSAGGDNIFSAKRERYPRLSLEEVIDAAPRVILLPDEPYHFTEEDLSDIMAHPEMPAVREGRVHLIDGKMIAWYGPRIGSSLKTLYELLC